MNRALLGIVIASWCIFVGTAAWAQGKARFADADARLNQTYQAVMRQLPASQQETVRTEQREWVRTRDTKAAARARDRSSDALLEATAALTEERITALQAYLTPRGGESQDARFRAADDRLNAAYKSLLARLSAAEAQRLKDEQRAWLRAQESTGSAARTAATEDRATALERLLGSSSAPASPASPEPPKRTAMAPSTASTLALERAAETPASATAGLAPPAPVFGTQPSIVAKNLGAMPKEPRAFAFNADGTRIALVGDQGSRQLVAANGVLEKAYDEIPPAGVPRFTTDGRQLLYAGREGSKAGVVIDGKADPQFDGIHQVLVSPKGARFAYIASRGQVASDGGRAVYGRGGEVLVSDNGKLSEPFGSVSHLTFSPDGTTLAYFAQASGKGGGYQVVHRGVASAPVVGKPTLAAVGGAPFCFSGDSQHLAYVMARGGNEEQVVVEGKAGKPYQKITSLQISRDGSRVAYVGLRLAKPEETAEVLGKPGLAEAAASGRKPTLSAGELTPRAVVDDRELPIYWERFNTSAGNVALSAAGRVAVIVPRERHVALWLDGKESAEYDRCLGVVFSEDGAHCAALMLKSPGQGALWYLLVDGQESDALVEPDWASFRFSPDGRRWSMPSRTKEGAFLFLDTGRVVSSAFAGELTRSPDGWHVAYRVNGRKGQALQVDERILELPGELVEGSITFSPDSAHVGCFVRTPRATPEEPGMVAWIDGQAQPGLARQYGVRDLEFSRDGKHFAYTAIVDDPGNPQRGGASNYFRQVRVIDGRPGPMLELMYRAAADERGVIRERMFPTTFGADGSCGYFAVNEGSLYRLEMSSAQLAALPSLATLSAQAQSAAALAGKAAAEKKAVAETALRTDAARHQAAQPFQVVHEMEGWEPGTGFLLSGADGRLYGSTLGGRFESGQFFVMERDGTGYRVIRSYDKTEGALLVNALVLAPDGRIFGSTRRKQDTHNDRTSATGTLFCYNPADGSYETLYTALPGEKDGWSDALDGPKVGAIGADGTVWGLCQEQGGERLFRLTPGTRKIEIVLETSFSKRAYREEGGRILERVVNSGFQQNADSEKKLGAELLTMGGNLYTYTKEGGRGGRGQIISLGPDGKSYDAVYEFAFKGEEGCSPNRLIAGDDGRFYGATREGGPGGDGAIFSVKPDGQDCRTLVVFQRKEGDVEALALAPDYVYFATDDGRQISRVRRSGGQPQTLHKWTEQIEDVMSLTVAADGTVSGATKRGGKEMHGVIFSLRTSQPGGGRAPALLFEGTVPQKGDEVWKATASLSVDPVTNVAEGWIEFPKLGARKALSGTAVRAGSLTSYRVKETAFVGTPKKSSVLMGISYLLTLDERTGRLTGTWSASSESGTVDMRSTGAASK